VADHVGRGEIANDPEPRPIGEQPLGLSAFRFEYRS
jgi:hypothetical protein